MRLRLALSLGVLLILVTSGVSAAVLNDSVQKGKDYYFAGEVKRAISQFESTIKADPENPEAYLWLGKSYELIADLKPPVLAMRSRLKARMYLAQAVRLAPGCNECRRELFDLLVSSEDSPSALRQAKRLLDSVPESDPEYASMQTLLAQAYEQSSSTERVVTSILSFPPQTLAQLSLHPTPALTQPRHKHSQPKGVSGASRLIVAESSK